MSKKLFTSLTLALWLFMATFSSLAQPNNFVVDTNGKPVDNDDEYYIRPAITDNGGRFTLINRNGSCPLHVGLENTDLPQGYPVKFNYLSNNVQDEDVRVNRELIVEFVDVLTTCVQSSYEWRVGENDTNSGRRVIITGRDDSTGWYDGYFRIVETQSVGIYNIQWCPIEVCPTCEPICSNGGILRENGKILFALDGAALPVVFQKKDD
ncbi:hypothetical protein VNO78_06625 [Psophocarpus tetragonolobus]|uniref:Uncharacterized protein n=1 Tax=Psophocarpus tetragonolobus TaxID=3891 RepID=A0AAN9SSH9_PSOTE